MFKKFNFSKNFNSKLKLFCSNFQNCKISNVQISKLNLFKNFKIANSQIFEFSKMLNAKHKKEYFKLQKTCVRIGNGIWNQIYLISSTHRQYGYVLYKNLCVYSKV